MTKSTVTTEAIAGVADLKAGYTLGHADVAILKALAAELLAAREAQSVPAYYVLVDGDDYEFNSHNEFSCGRRGGTPLFTAPPAPAVPPIMKGITPYCQGWNECRAAMLQPVSQGYTFDGLNIRAVAALRESVRNQWLKSEEFADKIYWKNMHSIANEIIEAMAAAPTPTKAVKDANNS